MCVVCAMLVVDVALPCWESSINLWGTGSMHGGRPLVVEFVSVLLELGVCMFSICCSSTTRALWSPYSGVWVDVCVSC